VQGQALDRIGVGTGAGPVGGGPAPEQLPVEGLGVGQHQVEGHQLLELLGLVQAAADELLQTGVDLGQQVAAGRPAVGGLGGAVQAVALVEAHPQGPGGLGAAVVDPGQGPGRVQRRQGLLQGGAGGHLGGGAAVVVGAGVQTVHEQLVAGEAGGPGEHHQGHGGGHADVGGAPEPLGAVLEADVDAGQSRLGEDDVLEQPGDEIAAPGVPLGGQGLAVEAEGVRQGVHQAVDGGPLLGAAGEVDAAQQGRRLVAAGAEGLLQEVVQGPPQVGELLGEGADQGAAPQVALLLHPPEHAVADPREQAVELGPEVGRRAVRPAGAGGEGHAPHLAALVPPQVVEELLEPRHQVALGEHHVDGGVHAELAGQLLDSLAHGLAVGLPLRLRGQHDVGQAHGHDHAVDRAARAGLAQQLQEGGPGGAVHRLLGVLGGVAPGGVHQHGVVAEPPVAVAGAADALHGLAAHPGLQGELQPRVDQGGGLAGPRRADDHVPRQLVEVLAARAVLEASLAEDLERRLEALPQHGHLLLGGLLGPGLVGGLFLQARHQLLVHPGGLHLAPPGHAQPHGGQEQDQDQAVRPRAQGEEGAESQVGPQQPDEEHQGDQPQQRDDPLLLLQGRRQVGQAQLGHLHAVTPTPAAAPSARPRGGDRRWRSAGGGRTPGRPSPPGSR